MTNEISREDVINVADRLGRTLSEEQIQEVLERYDDEAENDHTATWNLIVENCIYNLEN